LRCQNQLLIEYEGKKKRNVHEKALTGAGSLKIKGIEEEQVRGKLRGETMPACIKNWTVSAMGK